MPRRAIKLESFKREDNDDRLAFPPYASRPPSWQQGTGRNGHCMSTPADNLLNHDVG